MFCQLFFFPNTIFFEEEWQVKIKVYSLCMVLYRIGGSFINHSGKGGWNTLKHYALTEHLPPNLHEFLPSIDSELDSASEKVPLPPSPAQRVNYRQSNLDKRVNAVPWVSLIGDGRPIILDYQAAGEEKGLPCHRPRWKHRATGSTVTGWPNCLPWCQARTPCRSS